MRKRSAMPDAATQEQSDADLPEGWVLKEIGEIAKTSSGGTPARGRPDFYGGAVPWVKSGELGDGVVCETSETITELALKSSSAKIFPKGTVCIALYGATVGKVGVLGMDAATNQAVCGIFLPELIDAQYMFRYLQSIRQHLIDLGKGGAQPNISQEIVRKTMIPLPPLPEQKRIVAKVEELLARVNAAREHLAKVPAILKRFRQSVLAAACSGRLTEEWRGDHPDKTTRSLKVEAPEADNLPEIPETWQWVTLNDVSEKITDGEHLSPKTVPTGVPLLSAKDVREHGVEFGGAKFVSAQDAQRFRSRCDPLIGDILVVSRGATIGRVSFVQTSEEFCLMGSVILIKTSPSVINSFIVASLRSPVGQERMTDLSGYTAQQAIYIRDIRILPIPRPPLPEQQEIVRQINRLFALADSIEKQAAAGTARVEKLTQAILAKAFRGELVPQDPDDEPASILLDRIRVARAAGSKPSKVKRGKR